ncbi:MAG: hypothetical protein AAF697_11590 [Pseudomonadota bacterium]
MGLDLCVEGRAKPGHEAAWEVSIRRFFADEELSDAEIEHFQSISEPAYETLGAPRVGFDQSADDWIAGQMADRMTRQEAIAEFSGYHALSLIECDGLPKYTHAGLYEGVDETSFRGKWLETCVHVLSNETISEAWSHRMPDEAVNYGNALLSAAAEARKGNIQNRSKPSFLRRIFGTPPDTLPIEEQLDIVETAGRWFVFWGSRGHPIRAYY